MLCIQNRSDSIDSMGSMKVDTVFLTRRRLELGLAQCELAAQAGITPTALSRIMGGGNARLSTLRRLAAQLGVPVHQLYAEELDALAGMSGAADAA